MANNNSLIKQTLSEVTEQDFKNAIYLCYKDGITSIAPLGFSGDTIVLFGTEKNGRESLVSVRNYSGNAELLITDRKGSFLFYGRYDINLGVEFIAAQYWNIFLMVYDFIESEIENVSEFKNMKLHPDCRESEGFEMLKSYKNAHKDFNP